MPTRVAKSATPAADVVDGTPPPPRGADPAAWHALVTASPMANVAGAVDSNLIDEDEETAELDAAQRVRAVMGNNPGDGVRVSVYRRSPLSKNREWCADYTPDQFVEGGLPMVLAQLGPGAYEWRAFGGRGLLGRGSFDIAANARQLTAPHGFAGAPAPAQAPAVPDAVARALESLAQGQAALVQAIQATQQRPDPMQEMERMMMMAKLFKELAGPAPAAAPAVAPTLLEQINTLRAVKEFVKENQGDGPEKEDDSDNPLSLARPLIDLVKTALQRPNANTAANPAANTPAEIAAQQQLGYGNPENGMPFVSLPSSVNTESDEEAMQSVLKTLIEKAKANADISETGQFLFEYLPNMALPMVRRADAVKLLSEYAPPLAPHAEWLEKVRIECVRRLDEFESKSGAG